MKREDEELLETRVLLIGLNVGQREEDFERSMAELKGLAEACGKKVVGIVTQNLESANQAFYIGSGKVQEVREFAENVEAEEVIFDDTLTPSQMRNLGKQLERTVLDRTNLILDIFALRAQTREAKLQVETARLQYMLPRLVGMREALSRQGGASGAMSNKGAGETKLELDRRRIEHRISELQKELTEISGNRETMRKRRDRSGTPQVVLVGYTNAGKSTILNRMVRKFGSRKEKTVLEQDMLFATLDTSIRSLEFADHRSFLLADTVGFIDKLPHGLIKAFRSTLEEVRYADLLVHVVDYSDEDHKRHVEVTEQTLRELGAGDIPQILVYNKADLADPMELPRVSEDRIYMAASQDLGVEELTELIRKRLYRENSVCTFLFPYEKGGEASKLMELSRILTTEYLPEGIRIEADCSPADMEKYRKYLREA